MADINKSENDAPSLLERLKIEDYSSKDDFIAAVRGERVPHGLGWDLMQYCLIRGIRYHYGFAEEFRGVSDKFTRALNARSIMSNIIPDMDSERPEEFPYCIWFPDIPSEETCRDLVKRYPQMVYHVGRTCAVAGYTDLYKELDIFPEVHIAEEARECGIKAIYDLIMESPQKYSVMDDYTREIHIENPKPAFLNGDTAVRSTLELKQDFYVPNQENEIDLWFWYPRCHENTFNITEDMNVDEYDSREDAKREDVTALLYAPLPADLPTMDKDTLILMAAYYGDIDRYARLRRPKMHPYERYCVIRGIYHNTLFAKWWSLQDFENTHKRESEIEDAINARFIMNNDLSRITKDSRRLPYIIYRPELAQRSTYKELGRREPRMLPQVLRACIIGDYEDVFDELYDQVTPDWPLLQEAEASFNHHYLKILNRRVKELDVDISKSRGDCPYWKGMTSKSYPLSRSRGLGRGIPWVQCQLSGYDAPDGSDVDVSCVELNMTVPEEWKLEYWKENPKDWDWNYPVTDYDYVELDYDFWWPPAEVDPGRSVKEGENDKEQIDDETGSWIVV